MPPEPINRPEVIALLQASKETPDDDTPRLVLADWLEDHGEDARGQLIRWQCQAARLEEHSPERWQLQNQADALLRQHRDAWLGPLLRLGTGAEFVRGLVRLTCTASALARLPGRGQDWAEAWAWVEEVRLTQVGKTPNLFALPIMRRITTLDLNARNNHIGDAGVEALSRSPHLDGLLSLRLEFNGIGPEGARTLAGASGLERLQVLDLSGNDIGAEGARALASAPFLGQLSSLSLNFNKIGADGVQALVRGRSIS